MTIFERALALPVSCDTAFAWHARVGAFPRLTPPWQDTRVTSQTFAEGADTLLMDGGVATLSIPVGPVRVSWTARHSGYQAGRQFIDTMENGPFTRWVHTHRFEPAPTGCTLIDRIDYELGAIGLVASGKMATDLDRLFQFRHARTAADLAAHARHPGGGTVAITGATGLLGTALGAFLTTGGHSVRRFGRKGRDADINWDPATGSIETEKLRDVDTVVHLAGASIAERWTDRHKVEVMESRRLGTRLIARALAELKRSGGGGPRTLISASAVGIYGDRVDEEVTEDSAAGSGFAAEVCKAWEASTAEAEEAGIRVVHLRLGVVLSARGGALAQMLPPFRAGLGGPVGSGRQWLPWVADDDVLDAIALAMDNDRLRGPINVVSPGITRQRDFARSLGEALGRPAFLPAPAFGIRAMFGEMGQELLLGGQHVLARRLEAAGFHWRRPELAEALAWELGG